MKSSRPFADTLPPFLMFCSTLLVGFLFGVYANMTLRPIAPDAPVQEENCPTLSPSDQDQAKGTLIEFLGGLFEEHYTKAAPLYAGDYSQLRDWNPTVDPNDKPRLWQHGCEENGLNCLEIRNLSFDSQPDNDTMVYNVWFSMPDKITEFRGQDGSNITKFTLKRINGAFKVMTMPPYTE